MKIVVVFGGEMASAEALVKPDALDLESARVRYRGWYEEEYLPALRSMRTCADAAPKFLTFEQWLKEREGCREATADEVELYEE